MSYEVKPATPTERQGQFLAYIFQYSLVNGRAPAEVDMQRYFQITPPSVHSTVLTLERRGFIERVPGQARSITLLALVKNLYDATVGNRDFIQACCQAEGGSEVREAYRGKIVKQFFPKRGFRQTQARRGAQGHSRL